VAMAIGIIGGTGLYDLPGLEQVEQIAVDTPFGRPSAPITRGIFSGQTLLFLARHGRDHSLLPSEVNYRANIYALKAHGARWCLSLSAVGSLQEHISPGHVVVPDQFLDRTRGRASTFFGDGIAAHVPFADPVCPVLRRIVSDVAGDVARSHGSMRHDGGTYVCMEGPAFSTRAESMLYRSWGGTIIGMTNLPEAKLAREAEIAYATLALVTDYDCWRSHDADVDVQDILATLQANVVLAKEIISAIIPRLAETEPSSIASNALQSGILTAPGAIREEVKNRLAPIIGRYVG
ncbi:MAG: S-methyl-5'-thioadenosine phosphorylase, partial [Bdellovibrionales bacterium]|nr:S-methyl-5'-thioadenosine phosphorylase [Bdellovibrionales bacterium]